MEVGAWVYKNFDSITGLTFLPFSNHTYEQAPFQDMTEQQMIAWKERNPTPEVDWKELYDYESSDNTVSSQTLACSGGNCEIL